MCVSLVSQSAQAAEKKSTTDRGAYKQQKCIAHSSGNWKSDQDPGTSMDRFWAGPLLHVSWPTPCVLTWQKKGKELAGGSSVRTLISLGFPNPQGTQLLGWGVTQRKNLPLSPTPFQSPGSKVLSGWKTDYKKIASTLLPKE